jgi:hypothetical protein
MDYQNSFCIGVVRIHAVLFTKYPVVVVVVVVAGVFVECGGGQ